MASLCWLRLLLETCLLVRISNLRTHFWCLRQCYRVPYASRISLSRVPPQCPLPLTSCLKESYGSQSVCPSSSCSLPPSPILSMNQLLGPQLPLPIRLSSSPQSHAVRSRLELAAAHRCWKYVHQWQPIQWDDLSSRFQGRCMRKTLPTIQF